MHFPKSLFLLSLILMVFSVFAGISTVVSSDSLGSTGGYLFDQISKVPFLQPIAYALTVAILGLLYQAAGRLLNFLKFKYRLVDNRLVTAWYNRFLAKCLGNSALYYNIKIDSKGLTESEKLKAEDLKIQMLKEHFKKHDPLLKIDIKKLTD